MPTEIELANKALFLLGEADEASLTASTKNARILKQLIPTARDSLLEAHDWAFAGKRAALSADATNPAFGWDYRYRKPQDFIKLRRLDYNDHNYLVEGEYILSDYGPPLNIVYTFREDNYGRWHPLAFDALAARVAMQAAPAVGGDSSGWERANDAYKMAMTEARRSNVVQASAHTMDADIWLRARLQGG